MNLRISDSVATLTMTGDGVFNADTLAAFNSALDAALQQASVDLLLLTGEEKSFSQGLDLEFLMGLDDATAGMTFVQDCMRMIGRLLTFPMPVAAAVNGHAFGLGAMLTLASDYKVMREDRGYFCLPEVDLGMTLTRRMNALVCGKLGGAVLRDVLLTGRRLPGAEALAGGVVDALGPRDALLERATELAAPMRGKKREALAGLKRGIHWDILAVIEADEPCVTIQCL